MPAGIVDEPLVDDALVELHRLADDATRIFRRTRGARAMYGSPRTSWMSDSHLDSTRPYSWMQIEQIAMREGWSIEVVWMPGWPIPDAAPARRSRQAKAAPSAPLVEPAAPEARLFELPPAA